jgi:hypothetical protein
MNPTLVAKGLSQSMSGKGINLATEKARTEKREQEEKKSDLFCGYCGGYCFDTNDDWIQCMM